MSDWIYIYKLSYYFMHDFIILVHIRFIIITYGWDVYGVGAFFKKL